MSTASGPIGAVLAPIVQASKAWASDVNTRGGLNGHAVELIVGDDGGDSARALALTKRMVEQDKITALYNVSIPLTLHAVTPYLEQNKVPAMDPCSCTLVTDSSPMVFPIGGSPSAVAYAHVLPLVGLSDKRKAAIIYCQEAAVCKTIADTVEQSKAKFGMQFVYKAQASLVQPDYTAEMLAAKNAGAEAVILVMENSSTLRIVRSAHRQGYSPVFSSQWSAADARLLENDTTGDLDGLLLGTLTADFAGSPKMADYRAALEKYIPGPIQSSMGASAWAAGKLMERFGSRFTSSRVTTNDFLEGLYSLRAETAGGILPPIAYRRNQPHGDTNHCVVPLRVAKRRFTAPKGDEFVCHPDWKPVQP